MTVESVPRVWRERRAKYRLLGSRCRECGATYYPPRQVCMKCGSRSLEEVHLPRKGRLLTYTVIWVPPTGFEKHVPYIVGIVELEDGTRVLAQVTDIRPGDVEMGMELEAVFRKYREQSKSGIIEYGIKFRPPLKP